MADSKELLGLLENRIPEARKQLRDSHKNLSDLATYCEHNYVESGQGGAQLEETKRYAAQSLASVAYQVNVLAVGVLELLDKQMKQMGDMEASIHHIAQAVDIHKEKVARREIGALASSKNITRAQKVVVPAQKERPQKFTRQRLDFTALDGIGHGTRVADSTTRIDERYSGKETPAEIALTSSGSIGRAAGLAQKPDPSTLTFTRPMAPVAPVAPIAPIAPYTAPPIAPSDSLPPPPPMAPNMAPAPPMAPVPPTGPPPLYTPPTGPLPGYTPAAPPPPPMAPVAPAPPPPPPGAPPTSVGYQPAPPTPPSMGYQPPAPPPPAPPAPVGVPAPPPPPPPAAAGGGPPAPPPPVPPSMGMGAPPPPAPPPVGAPVPPPPPSDAGGAPPPPPPPAGGGPAPPPPPPPPPVSVQKKVEIRQTSPPQKQTPPPPAGFNPVFNPAAIKLRSTGSKFASSRGSVDEPPQSSPNIADTRPRPSPQVAPRPSRTGSMARTSTSSQDQAPPPPPPPGPSTAAPPPPPPPAGGPGGAPPPPPPPPPMGFNANKGSQPKPEPKAPASSKPKPTAATPFNVNDILNVKLGGARRTGGRAPKEPPPPPPPPPPSSEPDWAPQTYLEKVEALYDYTKDKDDELTFSTGAIIYVVKKNDDGWYEGVLNGITGLFPGNYVEVVAQGSESAA